MGTIKEYNNLMIQRDTQGGIPNLPFLDVKNAILGKEYELSLLFPDTKRSIELHKQWKKKNDPVNVLAFPLEDNEGEIIITLQKARSEAKHYKHTYLEHVLFLFIHACLHLKGMDHGAKMESCEQHWMDTFSSSNKRT